MVCERVVTFDRPVTLSDGRTVDVVVRAEVTPPVPPVLRLDPDGCSPASPGEFRVLSIQRRDTGESVAVDLCELEAAAFTQAEYEGECAYEDALDARAEAAREREWAL